MNSNQTFQQLINLAGGTQSAFLKLVNKKLPPGEAITPQALSRWANQIPANRVLLVASIFPNGPTPQEIRPDVFGAPERSKQAA